MKNQKFRGTGVAMVTPFKNGMVDYDALENVIEFLIAGGTDYIVCLGTTGESVTLSEVESRAIFDFTIKINNNRIPLVAGMFGGNNTAALKKRLSTFDFTGFDAILSSSPSYNKPSQEGIYQHYMQIGETTPLPIIVYNVPGRTASNISAETTIRIANGNEKFIAIKEASGDILQGTKIIRNRPKDFLVLSGDDPTCFALTAAGGDGVISVIGNAYPKEWSALTRNILTNHIEVAKKINLKFEHLHKWLYIEGNPVGIKAAMELKGLCRRDVRLPLVPISDSNMSNLKEAVSFIEELDEEVGVR